MSISKSPWSLEILKAIEKETHGRPWLDLIMDNTIKSLQELKKQLLIDCCNKTISFGSEYLQLHAWTGTTIPNNKIKGNFMLFD